MNIKHRLPDQLFVEPLDAEEEYWLGFCAARLSVYGKSARFSIDKDNVDTLRRFADLFQYEGELYLDERGNSYQFRMTNEDLLARLAHWGLTAEHRNPPASLADSYNFWLGFLDRKGTLYTHESGRQSYSFSTRFAGLATAFSWFCRMRDIHCKIYRRGAGSYQLFVTNKQDIVKLIHIISGIDYE
jgi:hypothetical protein